MLFGRAFITLTLANGCRAGVHFTTRRWEIEQGKTLVLMWADAIGVIDINLANLTARGLRRINEIAKNYEGGNTLTWTPGFGLAPGDYVLCISDRWSTDESPKLSVSRGSLQDNTPRDTSDESSGNGSEDGGLTPNAAAGIGVGSTLGGILLLGLVAFLVYHGRQNRTKLEDREAGERDKGKREQKEPQVDTHGVF
ncbi:hypothetical protein F4776DRAFT_668367 [Hypoxylon sp. NC0597]|nr:hypothetical protein F4776DRAFT_668367 [Hypoxylon sp. NC0597]